MELGGHLWPPDKKQENGGKGEEGACEGRMRNIWKLNSASTKERLRVGSRGAIKGPVGKKEGRLPSGDKRLACEIAKGPTCASKERMEKTL